MTEGLPPDLGHGPTNSRSPGPWMPIHPTAPPSPPRVARGLALAALALAAIATIAATAALALLFTRPTNSGSSATRTSPSPAAPDVASAEQRLCDTYRLAAKAVQVDTSGSDKGLARVATTNGAIMLEMAAADPALDFTYRDAARALAMSYATLTAKSSSGVANDAEFQSALDDIVSKNSVMKKVCGGG